jgi:hypothetical protein
MGVRHICRVEIRPCLLQAQREVGIAGEAIQLGDHRGRPGEAADIERLSDLGAVVELPALYSQ